MNYPKENNTAPPASPPPKPAPMPEKKITYNVTDHAGNKLPPELHTAEVVLRKEIGSSTFCVERIRVAGGWLYVTEKAYGASFRVMNSTFVPDYRS